MGADLLIVLIPHQEPEIVRRNIGLIPEDFLAHFYDHLVDLDVFGWTDYFREMNLELPEAQATAIRTQLLEAVEFLDAQRRDVDVLNAIKNTTDPDNWFWATGGPSFGDEPTEAYPYLELLALCHFDLFPIMSDFNPLGQPL